VETKLQGISTALAEADAILASTDFENDRQIDEEKRLDENDDDVVKSKNLVHALDLDPLIVVPQSSTTTSSSSSKLSSKIKTEKKTEKMKTSTEEEEGEEKGTKHQDIMTTKTNDTILDIVDKILSQVEARHDGLNSNALKSLINEYFNILDVDQNPLDAYCEALEKHCQVPDGTISRALLRDTLVNTLRVTPNHLIRLASAYHVVCPVGLVVDSQFEDRLSSLEQCWKRLGLAIASKLDDGSGKLSRVALSEFLQRRDEALGSFRDSRLEVSDNILNMATQFLPILKRDFFENVSVYVRIAGMYGIYEISENAKVLSMHQKACRELTCRAASSGDMTSGVVASEGLWDLAHMYETSCEDGNQFRTIGLVGLLQHLPTCVDDSHHRLFDAARCLELFFASDHDEVNVMLSSLH